MRISEAGQDFNLWNCLRLCSFCVWWWILSAGVGLWILPEEEFLPVFALRGFLYLKSLAIVTEFGIVELGTWITSAAPSFDHLPSIWAGELNFGTYDHMSYCPIYTRSIMDQLLSKSFKHNSVSVQYLSYTFQYYTGQSSSLATLYSPMANLT